MNSLLSDDFPPLERELSLSEALKRALRTATEMRLQARFEYAHGSCFQSAHCCLTDEWGYYVDHGYGKGRTEEARVGAIYEALEHWLNKPDRFEPDRLPLAATRHLVDELRDVVSLTCLSTFNDLTHDLRVREYRSLTGGDPIYLPAVLSSPWYAEEVLGDLPAARYCTNSGVAIGNTENEAIIHGLLEAVEREAISNFLVDVFVYGKISALVRIAPCSLPEHLREILSSANEQVGAEISIFRIASDFRIPTYCASFHDDGAPTQLSGFGASLSSEHAIKRAISELVQGHHIVTKFHRQAWAEKVALKSQDLQYSRVHTACYQMRIVEKAERLQAAFVPFVITPSFARVSLHDYLTELVRRIRANGRDAYVGFVTKTQYHAVVHAYISKQSFFFGALEGSLVFPDI